jgi:arsenate reductase (thioredoxin)
MKKIAFVCIHNSCRSQMAEAIAKHFGEGKYEIHSAGTEDYPEIKPLAVKVIEEKGINIKEQYPKLTKDIPQQLDILITMGCGAECPYIPTKHREDWGLEDPSGKPIEEFRKTRDLIEAKVKELFKRIEKQQI